MAKKKTEVPQYGTVMRKGILSYTYLCTNSIK